MNKATKSKFALSYSYIENLVKLSKNGDAKAKELLALQFTPFIKSLSRKYHIYSYESSDIINECYRTLFKCLKCYDMSTHRFVAYAYNSIINSVNCLTRNSIRRACLEGSTAFIMDDSYEHKLCTDSKEISDIVHRNMNITRLNLLLNNLSSEEKELVNYVYLEGNSLRKYSLFKGITYYAAKCRKDSVLNKLKL